MEQLVELMAYAFNRGVWNAIESPHLSQRNRLSPGLQGSRGPASHWVEGQTVRSPRVAFWLDAALSEVEAIEIHYLLPRNDEIA